jgi:hypothetical protein
VGLRNSYLPLVHCGDGKVPQAASDNSKQQHDSCVPQQQQNANGDPTATCQTVTTNSIERPTSVAAAAGEAVVAAAAAEPSVSSSSSIMVVWRDEMHLPSDEQQRHDQLSSYNILDTVSREQLMQCCANCLSCFLGIAEWQPLAHVQSNCCSGF